MVDHLQDEVIEVGGLVHRLVDADPIAAPDGLQEVPGDRDGLVPVGLAVDARGDEVAEPPSPEEVADAAITAPIPGEEDRARADLPALLREVEPLVRREVQLPLHHPIGPLQREERDLGDLPHPDHRRGDRLARSRIGRGPFQRDFQPRAADHQPGPDPVDVGPHRVRPGLPAPSEIQRQPVVPVAAVDRQ
jgi:hypothetical protein